MKKLFLTLFVSVFLLSCGGGSTSSTPAITEAPDNTETPNNNAGNDNGENDNTNTTPDDEPEENDNTLNLDVRQLDEYSKRVVGETYSINDALSLTADTFTSSDDTIATVNTAGQVTVHKTGFVEITAEDSSAAITTTIDIFAKDAAFHFKSWVGENNSLIEFNNSLLGLTFIRATDETCQPIPLINCGSYESNLIDDQTVTDSITTLNNPGFYNFTFGENTAATSMLSAEKFEVRSGEATLVFNNQLYLIGGYTTGDVNTARIYKNDVWVSKDGDEWLEITEEAEFSARSGHQVIVHNNQLWLLGGSNNGTVLNDVWVSDDGKTWTPVNQQAPYSIRTHFELFTLNDEFFVAGGHTTHGEHLHDLWRSTDGSNWSAVANFDFAEASNSPVVVLGENGTQEAFLFGDKTYRSNDGSTWTEADASPIFSGFNKRKAAFINGEIWLFTYTSEYFGSRGYKNISRIFKSEDGLEWSTVKGGIYLGNLIAREAKPIAFKDRLFIVGGRAEFLEYTNEVWSTTDAILWVEHTLGGFYGPRHSHAMTSHNGKLYSTGGVASDNESTASPYKADVWHSEDGLSWTLVADEHPTFRARRGHNLLSVGDKLCYIGGYGRKAYGTASGYRDPYTAQNPDPAGSVLHVILFRTYGVFNDIACSSDGGTVWSEVVPSTDDYFSARGGFASIYFNNKLWVIGGSFNDTYYGDVWSSDTPENWDERMDLGTYGAYLTEFTQATSEAPFGPRTGHAVTVHNGELYLSAGKNSEGYYLDDLWKTSDGTTWTQVNNDMGEMHKRAYHQMVSFDGKLWIIAGRANYHETLVYEESTVYEANDIWVSEDNGLTWTEVTEHANFEQRQNFQAVVHNNSLYIAGGTGGDGYVTLQGKDSILNDIWRSEDGINWRAGFYKEMQLSR